MHTYTLIFFISQNIDLTILPDWSFCALQESEPGTLLHRLNSKIITEPSNILVAIQDFHKGKFAALTSAHAVNNVVSQTFKQVSTQLTNAENMHLLINHDD